MVTSIERNAMLDSMIYVDVDGEPQGVRVDLARTPERTQFVSGEGALVLVPRHDRVGAVHERLSTAPRKC